MTPVTFILLLPILFAIGFWVATTACVGLFMQSARFRQGLNGQKNFVPPVSLIKPVCGLEKNLPVNLATACRQNYADYEVIFAVQSAHDPALSTVASIQAGCGKETVAVVVDDRMVGANGKVNNIYNASRRARGEVLVVSDSDMHLGPDYLEQIVAPLQDEKIGIVCTLYQAVRPGNFLEMLELLTYNSDFVPAMIFAYLSGTSIVCPGATMAIRREALEAVGGLAPLGDYFVEDFELGRRVTAKGYRVVLIPYIAGMDMTLASFTDWWRHQVCWDQKTKAVNATGHFLTLLVRGVPFALLYALLGGPHGLTVLAGTLGMRIFTGMANALFLKDIHALKCIVLLPLRDLLGVFVWIMSLFKRKTYWRGQCYRLKKGRMVSTR